MLCKDCLLNLLKCEEALPLPFEDILQAALARGRRAALPKVQKAAAADEKPSLDRVAKMAVTVLNSHAPWAHMTGSGAGHAGASQESGAVQSAAGRGQ